MPLMKIVTGRRSDIFTLPDHTLIHGEFFTHLFYDVPNVKQFRLLQDRIDHFQLTLVTEGGFGKHEEREIINSISNKTKNLVKIDVDYAEDIERLASGKFCFTKSVIKPKI